MKRATDNPPTPSRPEEQRSPSRLLSLGLLLGLSLLVSIQAAMPTSAATPMEIRDVWGRSILVNIPAKRVSVISRELLELLRALNALDLVVSVSDTIDRDPTFWPELVNLPRIGKWMEPDYEAIVASRPDALATYGRYPGPEAEARLTPLGVPVLRLDTYRPSCLEADLRSLAVLVGWQAEAEALLAWIADRKQEISACAAKTPRQKSVFVEGYTAMHAAGPESGHYETAEMAGLKPVTADQGRAYGEIQTEWLLTRNPEVIFKAASIQGSYAGKNRARLVEIARSLLARPAWDSLPAVRDRLVAVISPETAGGPRAVIGAAVMARMAYPESCGHLDPEAMHRDYFKRFMRMDYQGSWEFVLDGANAGGAK